MDRAARRTKVFRPVRRAAYVLRFAVLFLFVLPAAAFAQRNAVQGTIRGSVLDETTGAGIANVDLTFIDGSRRMRASAMTDSAGNFTLTAVPPGSFRLRASRFGYVEALTPYWRVDGGEVLTVTVRLHPDAMLLAPLEIEASVRSRSPVLSNYYQRLNRRMGGIFITREEIERSNAGALTDLLRAVPGVRIEGGFGQHARAVTITRAIAVSSFGNGCPVQIYLDGVLASRNNSEPVPVDELATPAVLEGIEIHRGLSTVPPEFLTPEARCGVIALWTRRGG